MSNTSKKIASVIGIIVGIIIIIIGFTVQDTSTYSIGKSIEFGADFYTEIYDVTKEAGTAIRSAINDLIVAISWLIISLGAIDICFFAYKFVQANDASAQPESKKIDENIQTSERSEETTAPAPAPAPVSIPGASAITAAAAAIYSKPVAESASDEVVHRWMCDHCGKMRTQTPCEFCGTESESADINSVNTENAASSTEADSKANENTDSDKKTTVLFAVISIIIVFSVIIGAIAAASGSSDDDYSSKNDTKYTSSNKDSYNSSSNSSYGGSYGSSYESVNTALKFSNIQVKSNSSYTVCTGTVTNKGSKTYEFVKIKGAFQNSSGTTLDTDWTYAIGSEGLAPGESTTFYMSVDKNYSISKCSISIFD